jgi:hypothetical protein
MNRAAQKKTLQAPKSRTDLPGRLRRRSGVDAVADTRAAAARVGQKASALAIREPIIRGHRIGTLVGWAEDRAPLVDFPGNPAKGPVRAQMIALASPPTKPSVGQTAAVPVLLTFDAERADRPIVVGLLASGAPTTAVDAVVDGKRVVITGHDEIVLQCGQASITLRRNGRVVVRGTYVETRSKGTNRIRGGTVEIN